MNSILRDIFRAIHEGRWLKIEYKNKNEQKTNYWIGIQDLDVARRRLTVDGLHLGMYTVTTLFVYIDSILSSEIVEGSYCPVNQKLVEDISLNPQKYRNIFENVANLKILNYLEMCNRLDAVPYRSDFDLVRYLDRDSFTGESYELSDEQFKKVVSTFQYRMEHNKNSGRMVMQQLAMNVLSIHTSRGLYVLAYRKLQLDIKRRVLTPEAENTICTEYSIDGTKQSIRKYLDADEYELLKDFDANQEAIKDCITRHNRQVMGVDDMPYIIGLGMEITLDLHTEYQAVINMYNSGEVTFPIRAFFGDILERPRRRKAYPIALVDRKINLDQLLAINTAMKYPVTYVQGPPGTGKTNTILNTIITAFFNEKTVLFASYNNHPIDSVFEKLRALQYRNRRIPFPVLRLGNRDVLGEALRYIKEIYERTKEIKVFEETLDKRKDDRIERAKQLSALLRRYENVLDLKERREAMQRLLEYQEKIAASNIFAFQADVQDRQITMVNREIDKAGEITDESAIALLDRDEEELRQYLFYTSAKYMKRLGEPSYDVLRGIIYGDKKEDERIADFRKYLSESENIRKLQRVFPVMITTCISAHGLGAPEPLFDMVVIDEASQCNVAVSLVPIIRGKEMMLVGDTQQLNPVILLDPITNRQLRKKYNISDEYDYRENSIYKTYLACDSVSDEILLRNHYRCNKKIIDFNNKKYYNSRLRVKTESREEQPLVLVNVDNTDVDIKNTAPQEAQEIIRYAARNKDKSIGVITPFVNQKNLIESAVKREGLSNIACGTVHSFQGDEKDVVLFSLAITGKTYAGTYEWLKNNKELINVATSRAREKLIVFVDEKNLERLHQKDSSDDLYELVKYVKTNGVSQVTEKRANSRALGVKPFSTQTEEAFLANLTHALENIWLSQNRYTVRKEVAISQVFQDNISHDDLFYTGRFDFVVYEKNSRSEIPILAIELDGKEHFEDAVVQERDRKKNRICREHQLQLIRVENSYARRYNHIKDILTNYFSVKH